MVGYSPFLRMLPPRPHAPPIKLDVPTFVSTPSYTGKYDDLVNTLYEEFRNTPIIKDTSNTGSYTSFRHFVADKASQKEAKGVRLDRTMEADPDFIETLFRVSHKNRA